MTTKWKIVYGADCEGNWLGAEITGTYPTKQAALTTAREAYLGEDECGNRAWFAAVPANTPPGGAAECLALAKSKEEIGGGRKRKTHLTYYRVEYRHKNGERWNRHGGMWPLSKPSAMARARNTDWQQSRIVQVTEIAERVK